jgi:hypothetical protein
MSSQPQRPSPSRALLSTLVIASLFACACGAAPEPVDDGSSDRSNVGTGGGSMAGASGFANGSAGSASSGGAIGVAGSFGTSGSTGTAGSFAAGGAVGVGVGGYVGIGSGGSSAGAAGSGSAGGFGGQSFGGQGFGGQAHGGSGGSSGSSGSSGGAVTFTQLYTQYFDNQQFASNCTGSACHNPGTQKGIDFSTQAKGYATVKGNLSKVISQLSSGSMPQTRARWTSAELALVKAWQAEGAPNN